jgi:PelA/Pel-15E family pectate lyase
MRGRAAASIERGIDCILETQIFVAGRCTVWCQQHDGLTLEPTSARNYEMPCQTSSESAEIALFLMELPKPGARVVAAVRAAVAWFEKTQIRDVAYRPGPDGARHPVHSPGSGPLWARYYEIESDRPIFGDRDKTIHDKLEDISLERRKGYGWYRDTGARALQVFARWSRKHPDAGLPPAKTHP